VIVLQGPAIRNGSLVTLRGYCDASRLGRYPLPDHKHNPRGTLKNTSTHQTVPTFYVYCEIAFLSALLLSLTDTGKTGRCDFALCLNYTDCYSSHSNYTLRKKGYPAFQKTLGVVERVHICKP
jgi:hypothetical protein